MAKGTVEETIKWVIGSDYNLKYHLLVSLDVFNHQRRQFVAEKDAGHTTFTIRQILAMSGNRKLICIDRCAVAVALIKRRYYFYIIIKHFYLGLCK